MARRKKKKVIKRKTSPHTQIPHFWLLASLIYLLLVFIFFAPVIFKRAFFWEDFIEQNYIYRFFAATFLREGVLPFWNPYIWAGLPFVGDVQAAVFYPFNLLLTFFVHNNWLSFYVVEWQTILHVWLAGLLSFLAFKLLGYKNWPSLLAGIVYMFSQKFIFETMHTNILHSITWFPIIIAFFIKSLRTENILFSATSGFFLGILTLAGYPQSLIWLGFAFITVLIVEVFYGTNWIKGILYLSVTWLLGLGISLVQYLPTVFAFMHSARAHYTKEQLLFASLSPERLISLFIPNFFGLVKGGNFSNYWAKGPGYLYWELSAYAGILPILLFFPAFYTNKKKEASIALSLSVLGILMALGRYSPVYMLFFYILPPLKVMRTPAKFMILYSLGLSFTVASALQNMEGKNLPRKLKSRMLYTAIFIGLAELFFFFLYHIPTVYQGFVKNRLILSLVMLSLALLLILSFENFKNPIPAYLLIGAFIFIDLYLSGHEFPNGNINPRYYFAENDLIKRIKSEQYQKFTRANIRSKEGLLLPRNIGSIYRIFTTEGYNPMLLERYEKIRHVILKNDPERFFTLYNVSLKTVFSNGTLKLVRREKYLPRAFIAFNYRIAKDSIQLKNLLRSPEFDPTKEVIVPRNPGFSPDTFGFIPQKILHYNTNKIVIRVNAPKKAILVLSENFYPQWKAKIDGKEVEVFPVDYSLRGIVVPGGQHEVTFYYSQKLFHVGLALTLFFSVVSILGIVAIVIKKS